MTSVIDIIKHYQRSIEKYSEDEKRILHCIGKLDSLPIKVKHLQETGIGRTVNSLRKYEGQVGYVARTLVAKWKEMVTAESSNSEVEENSDIEQPVIDESNENSQEYQEEIEKNQEDCIYSVEKKNEENLQEEIENSFKEIEENVNNNRATDSESSYSFSHHKKKKHKSKHEKHTNNSSFRHSRSDKRYSKQTDQDNVHSSKEKHKTRLRNIEADTSSSKYDKEERKTEEKEEHRKHKKKSHKSDKDPSKKCNHHKSKSNDKHQQHQHSKHMSEQLEIKCAENVDMNVSENKLNKHKNINKYKQIGSSYQVNDNISNENENINKNCDENKSESPIDTLNEVRNRIVKEENKKNSKHKHNKSSHKQSQLEKKNHKESSKSTSKKESSTNKRKLIDIDIMVNNNVSSDDEGITSFSGTSFAEALGSVGTPNKKKLKTVINSDSSSLKFSTKEQSIFETSPKEKCDLLSSSAKMPQLNLDINLPEITPNYQPLPSSETLWSITQNKKRDDETLSVAISSKNQRTKVYSGGHRNTLGVVSSLFELCIRILQDNIDALAYTGGVPYSILYPVLEKASPEQLFTLEHYNAYLLEDTDELWEKHCKREFRGQCREELESWREAYSRFLVEREEKLKALTANIKQSIDKSKLPIRQTKLAYVDSVVKPPRAVARKQAKYGTGNVNSKPGITPSSRLAALATSTTNISVSNPGTRAATSHSSGGTITKPKKAPLMQKTLALIKSTNRYRR